MKKIILFSLLFCSSATTWAMENLMEVSAATTLNTLHEYIAREKANRRDNEENIFSKKRKITKNLPTKKRTRTDR